MRANYGRIHVDYLMFSLLVLVMGCNQPERTIENDARAEHQSRQKEMLMEHNRLLIAEEMSNIDAYVLRMGWNMDTTSTGLKYMRLDTATTGRQARLMDKVALSYTMSLLDGTTCYSSDSTGRLELVLGQSAEPAGLQQGILQLREGESALLLVPSYLAFGLTGDGDRVPGSSSIVYKIRLDTILERQP